MASISECCGTFKDSLEQAGVSIDSLNQQIGRTEESIQDRQKTLSEASDASGVTSAATSLAQDYRLVSSSYGKKYSNMRAYRSLRDLYKECSENYFDSKDACSDPDRAPDCCKDVPPETRKLIAQKSSSSVNTGDVPSPSGFVDVVGDKSKEPSPQGAISREMTNTASQNVAVPSSADAQQGQGDESSKRRTSQSSLASQARKSTRPPRTSSKIVGPASPPANNPNKFSKVAKTKAKK